MISKLFHYILEGNEDLAREILDKHPQLVAQVGDMGRTPLMEAAIFGRKYLTRHLLENGADVHAKDAQNWTALHFAAQSNSEEIAQLLIDSGANVNTEDSYGNTPLHRAMLNSRGCGNIIRLLLKYGADRNKENKSGISPYGLAKRVTNFDLLQFFE